MLPVERPRSFSHFSRQRTVTLSFILVIVLALIDLATDYINIPILYFIPIALCAKTGRRRSLIWLTSLVIVLTYALYFLDFLRPDSSAGMKLWYRAINRTMVALGLGVTAAAMATWTRVHEEWMRRAADAEQDAGFDSAVNALKRVIVIMLCGMMIFFIFVTDLMSPRQFNLPILYAVPLIIAAWAESRRLLWVLLPVLLAVTWVGYVVGPPMSLTTDAAPANALQNILTNRVLATFAQISVALIVYVSLTPRRPRETPNPGFGAQPNVAR